MQEYNIPYEQLELVGILPEDVGKMPNKFIQDLKYGTPTDVVIARITAINGAVVEIPMKLKLSNDEYGKSQLTVFPVMSKFDNAFNLNQRQFEALRDGQVLHIDGNYIQRDPQTNCLLKVSDKEMNIEQKFNEIEKFHDIELGMEQKNQLKNGKPLVLDVGGENVVIDLDLKNPNLYKTLKGDLNEWEYNKKVEYDILHPEFLGVVKTDENRWEYQQVLLGERYQDTLDQKPRMARNAGMSMH